MPRVSAFPARALASLFALFVAVFPLAGCRRGTSSTVAVHDARQVATLRRRAEEEMACASQTLTLTPMSSTAVEVRGCARIREYTLVCRRRRCAWHPVTPAAMLALTDLACSLEQMRVTAPGPATRDIVGCGRAARYGLACPPEDVCVWQLVGAGVPTGVASTPAGATSVPMYGETTPLAGDEVIPPPPGAPSAPSPTSPPASTPAP